MQKWKFLQRLFGYGILGVLSTFIILLLLYYSSPYTLSQGVSPIEHVANMFFCPIILPIGSFAGGTLGLAWSNWRHALVGGPLVGFIWALATAIFFAFQGITLNVCSLTWLTISNFHTTLLFF